MISVMDCGATCTLAHTDTHLDPSFGVGPLSSDT